MKDFFMSISDFVFVFFSSLGAGMVSIFTDNIQFFIGLSVVPLVMFFFFELRTKEDNALKARNISSLFVAWFTGVMTGIQIANSTS
ncbi:MAG: hypothetical protein F6K24_00275 [Okeania sp. SIO2D1]|nr:hypothetical protein [Okeania sp. SIO2D1]